MGVGGILLFLVSVRPSLGVLRDRTARRWVALGALGVLVYPLAFYSGMNLAGVAVGNVVALGSGPVFAALLEWLWERHPLSARWAVATGLALVGIVLLTLGRQPEASDAGGRLGRDDRGRGPRPARRFRLRAVHVRLVPGDRDHRARLESRGHGVDVRPRRAAASAGAADHRGAACCSRRRRSASPPTSPSDRCSSPTCCSASGCARSAVRLPRRSPFSSRSSPRCSPSRSWGSGSTRIGWVGLALVLAGILTLVTARPAPKTAARL